MSQGDPALAADSEADENRVAVLPFAGAGGGPDESYLADGMTEEVIGRLSRVKQLRVIAGTSVMGYKAKDRKLAEIAGELHVEKVVEGSVRKAGDRVRVAARLVEAATGEHLWSSHYDEGFGGVFAVQGEIASEVAGKLKVRLSQPEKEALEEEPTANMDAYERYLRGRALSREGSEPSHRRALKLFEEAAGLDRSFARAYVGVAECHQWLASAGYEPYEVMAPAVESSLGRALKLAPDLAGAHLSLALLYLNEDNAPGVEAEAKTALELNPSLSEAYNILFDVEGIMGEPEEMVRSIEAAHRLDPINRLYIEEVGQAYIYAGREKAALDHWKKTERQYPAGTYRNMTYYFLSKGDVGKARKLHAKVRKLEPAGPWVTYMGGYIDAVAGDRKRALLAIQRLEEGKKGPLAFNFVAYVYHALGDLDRYFENLDRALEGHAMIATFAMYSPILAKAREDPRYRELVEKLRRMNGLAK